MTTSLLIKGRKVDLPDDVATKFVRMEIALAPFANAARSFAGDPADAVFKISSLRIAHLRAAEEAYNS
jgi:hypothetical protein